MTLSAHPLPVPGLLEPGLDLVDTIIAAATATGVPDLVDGDVLVVASKVVALAEDRLVPLPDHPDARRQLARSQARRIVADHPRVLVVETTHGFVCANAGIDTSNVPAGLALLLPEDADASAARLRADLRDRLGVDLGIVIGDTFGRPWRAGQVDVAIGVAGMPAIRDERGRVDLTGAPLEVTVAAVADEVAGVADLVRDKATPIPFVLVRGLDMRGEGSSRDLVRDPAHDLFPAGGPTLADHAVTADRPGAQAPGAPDDRSLDDVVELVATRLPPGARLTTTAIPTGIEVRVRGRADATSLLGVGAALEDLRILATARGRDVSRPRPGPSSRPTSGEDDLLATVTVSG